MRRAGGVDLPDGVHCLLTGVAAMLASLLETYKQELGEFVSTVREDSSRALVSAAEKLKQLSVREDEGDEEQPGRARKAADFSRLDELIESGFLETDPAFEDFYKSFDPEPRREQIEQARESVQAELDKFVIGSDGQDGWLSEEEFWTAYFYFEHVRRRARLLAGGEPSATHDEDDLSWGDDDDEEGHMIRQDRSGAESNADPTNSSTREKPFSRDRNESHVEEEKDPRGSGLPGTSDLELRDGTQRYYQEALESLGKQVKQAEMRASLAEEKVGVLTSQISELQEQLQTLQSENEDLHKIVQRWKGTGNDGEVYSDSSWQVEEGSDRPHGEDPKGNDAEDEWGGWDE